MRSEMETILKEEFRLLALRTRQDLGLTQDKMSELLVMSERSYSDIENGHSACGTLTAMLLLIYTDEPERFIQNVQEQFARVGTGEKMTV